MKSFILNNMAAVATAIEETAGAKTATAPTMAGAPLDETQPAATEVAGPETTAEAETAGTAPTIEGTRAGETAARASVA